MIKKVTPEYIKLKKRIDTYIDKYDSPTRKSNDEKLRRLLTLKGTQYHKLREEIALSNGGFAMRYVMRYYNLLNDDNAISELFQESIIGLLEAIDSFDVSRNNAFTTHAHFHVKKRLIDFIKKNKLVKAPRDIARNIKPVSTAMNTLYNKYKRDPSINELQRYLKENDIILKDAILNNILMLIDLNSSGYEESFMSEFKDQCFGDPEQYTLLTQLEISINKDLNKFDDKTKEIIDLRFGINKEYTHTPTEIMYLLQIDEETYTSITV